MMKQAKMTSHSKKKRKCRTLVTGAIKTVKPVKTFPELAGLELHDAVYKRDPDEIIHIGSSLGSGFFFVGNRKEFNRDIDRLGENSHTDFRMRPVADAYSKIDPSEGVILIIEGDEQGRFWTMDEYRRNANVRGENLSEVRTGKKRGGYELHKAT